MLRRTSRTLLATALAASVLTAPAAADQPHDEQGLAACPENAAEPDFADVADGNVHAAAIACVASLGLVHGTTTTSYDPSGDATRGQIASMLDALFDHLDLPLPPTAGIDRFDDAGDTHGEAIHRLAAAGIVQGRKDGTFGPHEPVSREQLASILVNTWSFVIGDEVSSAAPAGFDDAPSGVHAANVDAAVELDLLRGRSDSEFAPRQATRRDQAATVIARLLDRAPGHLVGEVWSLDQGTDLIHVYHGATNQELVEIDVSPQALQDAGFDDAPSGDATVPHMIEFDSQERFAFIAATAGASTIVVDARTKEVVEVLPTGAGSHMAAVTPDDSAVWVAAIGAEQMVEIDVDLHPGDPSFTIERRLDVADLLEPVEADNDWQYSSYSPVCQQYSTDSAEAWITLGPGWADGAAFVLELDSATVSAAWDPEEIRANCGVSVSEDLAVLNWSGEVVEGNNTNGEWYVFDPDSKEQIGETRDARGFDAHGVRLSPDGSVYWMVNRASDNAIVVDADSLEVIAEYDEVADTPDILDFNADGSLVYISQRGPTPISGAPHAAAGDDPGVAIVDAATGELVEVIAPPQALNDDGEVVNDIHGVAFRIRGSGLS